jgi:hypothetical protein
METIFGLSTAVFNERRLLAAMVSGPTYHHLRLLVLVALTLNKHATPMALVFEAILTSIDISCLWHLRKISCPWHLTPMGLSRRGWCPHLPHNTFYDKLPPDVNSKHGLFISLNLLTLPTVL